MFPWGPPVGWACVCSLPVWNTELHLPRAPPQGPLASPGAHSWSQALEPMRPLWVLRWGRVTTGSVHVQIRFCLLSDRWGSQVQLPVRQWWQVRGWGPVRRDTPAWAGVRGSGYSAGAPATHAGCPESAALISLSPLLPARCICWVLIGFQGVSSEHQGEGGGLGRMGEGLSLCCCPQLYTPAARWEPSP